MKQKFNNLDNVMETENHFKNGTSLKNHTNSRVFNYAVLLLLLGVLSSCSVRMIDFTVISSRNHGLQFDLTNAQRVEGRSVGFLGIGTSIKAAMDDALDNAGMGYDLLLDGVVYRMDYFLAVGFRVTGTAVRSRELRAMLGDEGFENWLKEHNVFDPATAVVQK